MSPLNTVDSQVTFQHQSKLPRLPIPKLEDTARRYLRALEGLQDRKEHEATKRAVEEFVKNDGPRIQEKLIEYEKNKNSYIEEFWYESYLNHSDSVVLALNPFFVLEDDPSPSRGSQLPRAASLITSSLGFIHDLRNDLLEPDSFRNIPLDMDQYTRLFGTARIPTDHGCRMHTNKDSRHIVVIRRGQFYWFDVIDQKNRPILSEREILANLRAILADADTTPASLSAKSAVGILTTENRKQWASLRRTLASTNKVNSACLEVVDDALFVVCLDDESTENLEGAELCANFLCGTYRLSGGAQTGTCTNRWYDKLQIIVCANGAAGINFEHTGVDGHTVLRYAADIYTDNLLLLAKSINPSAPTLFKAKPSPYSRSAAKSRSSASKSNATSNEPPLKTPLITVPRKLEWSLTPDLQLGIRFAETRLSDLICQNDCQVLEFKGFGKGWITKHGFSPDAFVQMAFQAGYYGLYGRIECTYEPAMTKAFFHGRTEAIRTIQPESVKFTKTFFSEAAAAEKIDTLRKACEAHVNLTKDCSKGLGQDRHLYALYCLLQKEIIAEAAQHESSGSSDTSSPPASPRPFSPNGNGNGYHYKQTLPPIFTDPGWSLLNTSILSTSNCGNPALRLFGFGPVAQDGFGIGYIIKDDAISICASSKHLQTRRFLDTIQQYLNDVQRVVTLIYRQANERQGAFIDHSGNLIDSRTGAPLSLGTLDEEEYDDGGPGAGTPGLTEGGPGAAGAGANLEDSVVLTEGYSFFDSGEIDKLLTKNKPRRSRTTPGRTLTISEY